jgi:hypothetical protein
MSLGPPNREIFKKDGSPETETETWWREEQARQKNIQNVPQNPELQEQLRSVDFRLLGDIFAQTAARCGVPRNKMNFLPLENIDLQGKHTSSERPALGEYHGYENFARLYHDRLDAEAKRLGITPEYLTLKTLIHEEIHALSYFERKTEPGLHAEDKPTDIRTMGYQTVHIEYVGAQQSTTFFFELFDEGVTQRYTGEVLEEYLQATGAPAELRTRFERLFAGKDREQIGYALPMRFVDALIARLAHETGVPETNVWDAILRGKLEGHDLFDEEFAASFAELVGPDVLPRLMHATRENESDSNRTLRELTDKLMKPFAAPQRSFLASLIPKIVIRSGGPPEDRSSS